MNNTGNMPTNRPTDPRAISTAATLHEKQTDTKPSRDEIAKKAYSIYQARGCPQGLDLQHWLEAETHVIGLRNLSRIQN
jgi:hypothetical protein